MWLLVSVCISNPYDKTGDTAVNIFNWINGLSPHPTKIINYWTYACMNTHMMAKFSTRGWGGLGRSCDGSKTGFSGSSQLS